MMRVLNVSGRTVFVGSDLKRPVAVEFQPGGPPQFRILSTAEAVQWLGRVKTAQEWIGPGRKPDPLCCAGRSRADSLRTLRRVYIRARVHRR